MHGVSDNDGMVAAGINRFQGAFHESDGSLEHGRATEPGMKREGRELVLAAARERHRDGFLILAQVVDTETSAGGYRSEGFGPVVHADQELRGFKR